MALSWPAGSTTGFGSGTWPTGQELAGLAVPVQGAIRQVVFSPDGRQLAIAAREPTLYLVDRADGQVLRELHGHTRLVYCVSFSPDGSRLVSAGDDLIVRLWDTATGELQQETPGTHRANLRGGLPPRRQPSGIRGPRPRDPHLGHGNRRQSWPGCQGIPTRLRLSPGARTAARWFRDQADFTVRSMGYACHWPIGARPAKASDELRPDAERLVQGLLHELGDPVKVVEHIRADASLSEPMQRAAWHAVLRRTTVRVRNR